MWFLILRQRFCCSRFCVLFGFEWRFVLSRKWVLISSFQETCRNVTRKSQTFKVKCSRPTNNSPVRWVQGTRQVDPHSCWARGDEPGEQNTLRSIKHQQRFNKYNWLISIRPCDWRTGVTNLCWWLALAVSCTFTTAYTRTVENKLTEN